jgi:hypothetical protein
MQALDAAEDRLAIVLIASQIPVAFAANEMIVSVGHSELAVVVGIE